jgi:DNA-binding transcriptional regulator YhcF (GntR family)
MITSNGGVPIYKQLVQQFENKIKTGKLVPGESVPSMNELAEEVGISRETAKKVYSILRDRGYLEPHQGKGFYVKNPEGARRTSILVLFDKMSIYKQSTLNAFLKGIGEETETTILIHNKNIDLYEYYLNLNLDQFDYYVVTPHFDFDEETQKKMVKLTSRIPNRKLIVLDYLPSELKGNFGAVYQDFHNDAYYGLQQGLDKLKKAGKLRVITLKESLYGQFVRKAVERFCSDYGIYAEYMTEPPTDINKKDVFLLINSQLDSGISDLADNIDAKNLKVGKDVFIISYNEFPFNKVVLGGLTTISTDFVKMGELAAQMIVEKRLFKQKCDFGMIRRSTF